MSATSGPTKGHGEQSGKPPRVRTKRVRQRRRRRRGLDDGGSGAQLSAEEGGPDRIDGAPHLYTPEPGEVDEFLQTVLSSPLMHACLPPDPALQAHDLPIAARDHSISVLDSPALDTLSSADHPPSTPPPMPPPAAIEDCRKHLVPVLLASAQARDPATPLDAQQCARLLSDDHCARLFRKAGEMRVQLSSLVSSKAPARPGISRLSGSPSPSPSLRRDRADDADPWTRRTRARFDSATTIASDLSRRDSDATLVDVPAKRLPPKAPRAMLLASHATWNVSLNDPPSGAPDKALFVSPTTRNDSAARATALLELVHQAVKMFPALAPVRPGSDAVGTASGDAGQPPVVAPSCTTDFVSHLPTEPGIWFRQQGGQHAEIVDVDIDVSDDMFYVSTERVPFRLRAHLRLCSLPLNAATDNRTCDAPTSLEDIDGVIERHALHWPTKGKLVVQVNPESERSKTWLPYTLESDPLDVTSCVRPGKNTFRFIQLSDLSEFTFVLAASPPPPEQAWRSWDWASLVERPSSEHDPVNGLSEFARIPITLRS